jgi:replicative DNA helicase
MDDTRQYGMELSVLGSILKNSKNLSQVLEVVDSLYFSWIPYRDIFESIVELHKDGFIIDSVTVGDALERKSKLDSLIIHDQMNMTGRSALLQIRQAGEPENSVAYAQVLANYYATSQILELVTKGASWISKGRMPYDVIDDLSKGLSLIKPWHPQTAGGTILFNEAIKKAVDQTEKASRGMSTFIQTGFPLLDRIMVGLSAPDVTIVAARPGVGKTAFLCSILYSIMTHYKKTVAFFSLEMGSEQVAMRFISMDSGINFHKQRTGFMTKEEKIKYDDTIGNLTCNNYSLFLNDIPRMTPNKIRRELRTMGKVDLLVLDYLQLASSDEKNEVRHLEVAAVSRGLKAIAKEFAIPVLVAAQLSRAGANRKGDESLPIMSDLAESGSLERDADNIIFLDRDNGESETTVYVAKQRNGGVGKFKMTYDGEKTMFIGKAL